MTLLDGPQALEEGSRELALAGAALVISGLALAPLCVALARRLAPKGQVFFARWRFLHAALVAGIFFATAQLVPRLLRSALESQPEVLRLLIAGQIAFAASCAAILVLAARLDPDGARSLGLRSQGSLRAALVGLGCYALCAPGILGLQFLWPWLLERLGDTYAPQKIALGLIELSGPAFVLAALLVVLVQPCFEELIFRGFLQPLFVQNLGDRGGVALTSLVFAAMHGNSAFLPVFGLSLLLGSLKLRTQRLSAPFAVHALHNGVALALLEASAGA